MAWQSLLNFDQKEKTFTPVEKKERKPREKKEHVSASRKERGCEFCPLNEVKGLKKVKNLDKIQGKAIMAWAQNPGEDENTEGRELVGRAGRLLWQVAASVGLKREDCDIQNVVRCWAISKNELGQWEPREPSKEELHACSIFNEEAIERNGGQAKVHLVLGQVAARQLLKGEYKKDKKTFYSEKFKAWIVCTWHPSYFLRGAPKSKLKEFRDALASVVQKANIKGGKFAYVENLDSNVVPLSDLDEMERLIRQSGKRLIIDIEDGTDEKGKNVIVYVGLCWNKKFTRGIFLNHQKMKKNTVAYQKKLDFLKKILEDSTIKKGFQHGVYDVWKLFDLLGIKVKGFDHDTQYSEYFRFSGQRSYGLAAIADRRFKEFAGYKEILKPFKDETTGLVNFYTVPAKTIIIYNGADCVLTKRIEESNDGKVPQGLLQVYIYCAPPLARMEDLGPLFDWEYSKILEEWIPKKLEFLLKKLRRFAGEERFNPNSPIQVAGLIYDKLKLGKHLDEKWKKDFPRSTDKDTLQLLTSFSPVPALITSFRQLSKKKGTYMVGYKKSAELHGGRLKTKWWLPGTVTGRLRSGGERGEKEKSKGIVNLQNIHGEPEIENLLVSDLKWRELYGLWEKKRHGTSNG